MAPSFGRTSRSPHCATTQEGWSAFLTFDRQKGDVLGPFLTKGLVCIGPLLLKGLVFHHPLALDNLGVGRSGLSIRLRPSCRHHFVRSRTSLCDDGVRRLIDGSQLVAESEVRVLAFDAQALVGLSAFWTSWLVVRRHGWECPRNPQAR
jgi:hypothetical protein